MASYGNRFIFEFVSQNGDDIEIFITKKDFSGKALYRSLGRGPVLKRERNDAILGTSLEIYAECRVDGEFAELYTSSADEFRVVVYKNRQLQWIGFVTPELYAEPDIAPPYDVQIIATDGLGELKNTDFSRLDQSYSLKDHIEYILGHTGLNLDLELVSSLRWDDDAANHAPSDLLDLTCNLSHLADERNYDVLQDLLASLNACITQQDGKWLLVREADIYDNIDAFSVAEFGSANKTLWWPIGSMSTDIVPAKKKVVLTHENHYKDNILPPIYTGIAGGWEISPGAYYDSVEGAYVLPSSSSRVQRTLDFRLYPLRSGLSLIVKARCMSRSGGDDRSKIGITIQMRGTMSGKYGSYHLNYGYVGSASTDTIATYWASGDVIGFVKSWDAPAAAAEQQNKPQDIEVIIPFENASAESLTIELANVPGSPYQLAIYDVVLCASVQNKGVELTANISNGAREPLADIDVVLDSSEDGSYGVTRYGVVNLDGGITSWYTPYNSAADLLRFLARDYAMLVALPRMRYRGKLNVPASPSFRIPFLYERDNTYYQLNTYSYDLLNDEIEVELISIPNARVIIDSETVTELPSETTGGGSSSSAGGNGSGGSGEGGGSSTLSGLADVAISGLADGQSLVYDAASGFWKNKKVSAGGEVNYASIINALGYTPFDKAEFTKDNIKSELGISDWALESSEPSYVWTDIGNRPTALSQFTNDLGLGLLAYKGTLSYSELTGKPTKLSDFTNDLGLGNLAYKNSLAASDIPSLDWSKIATGKPTTLAGYGIADAYTITQVENRLNNTVIYSDYIDITNNDAARHIGYGYASIGWHSSGPAMSFGVAAYNLRMQLMIEASDAPRIMVSQVNNGTAYGWAELLTKEGIVKSYLDTAGYKSYGKLILYRIDGGDTYINYGAMDGLLRLYGTGHIFYTQDGALQALQVFNDGGVVTAGYLRPNADNAYALGGSSYRWASLYTQTADIKDSLTVGGSVSSANFVKGGSLYSDPSSSFQTTCFGSSSSEYRIKVMRPGNVHYEGVATKYGAFLAIASSDSHGYISFPAYAATKHQCYIGGGTADALNWKGILFHDNMDLLPKDYNTYALGDSSHRWSYVNVVSINAYGNIVLSGQLLGTTPAGGTYPRARFFSDASYYWMQIGSYDGLSAEGSMTICGIYGAGLKILRLIASNTIIGGASQFVSLATFDKGIKIGDATLTWDASAGMLKIDKGVYVDGAITAKKKA